MACSAGATGNAGWFSRWPSGSPGSLYQRLYGLAGPEGDHGEDVKECYYYLDATPTHSYVKGLYKYPQQAFPYAQLIEENARRGREYAEFELTDTGIFDEGRYFDVFVEYAKYNPDDVAIRITIVNHGPGRCTDVLLTLWQRAVAWG
jgi:hypothetical protein